MVKSNFALANLCGTVYRRVRLALGQSKLRQLRLWLAHRLAGHALTLLVRRTGQPTIH